MYINNFKNKIVKRFFRVNCKTVQVSPLKSNFGAQNNLDFNTQNYFD